MNQPVVRQPVHITGHRAIGEQASDMVLLIDTIRDAPQEGTFVFASPHKGFRILLRPYKKRTTADGTVISEIQPIDIQFEQGKYVTEDKEIADLLMKDKRRGKGYYAFEDLVAMKQTAVDAQFDAVARQAAEMGMTQEDLSARLGRILGGEKVFDVKGTAEAVKESKGGKK